MISDTLSEAIQEIDEYQKNREYSENLSHWINGVKGVMAGLQQYLDTPPIIELKVLTRKQADSLKWYVSEMEQRFGLKVKVVATIKDLVEVEVHSPTGIPINGGVLWWKRKTGGWLFGGLPKQFPEWWADPKCLE